MRDASARGRAVRTLPGFLACIDEASTNPLLSLVVPDGADPDDWAAALAGLTAYFAAARRCAPFEAFAELRPGLLAAADAAGWTRAVTAPVLVLEPEALTAPPPPTAGTYRPLDPAAAKRLHALLAEAFADGLPVAWLSAAEGALQLYEGLGFVRVGTQVNVEAP